MNSLDSKNQVHLLLYTLHHFVLSFVDTTQINSNRGTIYVMNASDKPLARLIVVRRLDVDKDQVFRFGILDTPLSLCVPL